MRKFFAANIDGRGRLIRGVLGIMFVIGAVLVWQYNAWASLFLGLSAAFCLFEAFRGWCVMRACGVRTRF